MSKQINILKNVYLNNGLFMINKIIKKIPHKDFKIGIWSLENNTFKSMKELTKKTKNTNLEHGGILCGDREKEKILLEQECVGNVCEIQLYNRKKICKKDEFHTGIFHTHPKTRIPTLSLHDIKSFMSYEFFSCLGTANNNKITCYTRASNSDEYWNNIRKEEPMLNKMFEIEKDLHEKRKKSEPIINYNLPSKELKKEFKKISEMSKYRKYYQERYLKKIELI